MAKVHLLYEGFSEEPTSTIRKSVVAAYSSDMKAQIARNKLMDSLKESGVVFETVVRLGDGLWFRGRVQGKGICYWYRVVPMEIQ